MPPLEWYHDAKTTAAANGLRGRTDRPVIELTGAGGYMEFSEDQRLFLQAVCQYFHNQGNWPTYGFLDRMFMDHDAEFDLDIVGRELDSFMYDGLRTPASGWAPTRQTFLIFSPLYECLSEGISPALSEVL